MSGKRGELQPFLEMMVVYLKDFNHFNVCLAKQEML